MARRKQSRAPKNSSASRSSRVTYYYRTRFVAYGDLLGRDYRIPVKVALPADDWCIGLFQVTPLSAFGESVFRQALSRLDVVALYIAGRNINALVATKGTTPARFGSTPKRCSAGSLIVALLTRTGSSAIAGRGTPSAKSCREMADDCKDDAVGYKRPPPHTRFRPGHSGNPSGRPKRKPTFRTALLQELAAIIPGKDPQRAGSKLQALVKTLVDTAIAGDARANRFLSALWRGWAMPTRMKPPR